jgi:CDP-diacylglycerol pyrophosphatase
MESFLGNALRAKSLTLCAAIMGAAVAVFAIQVLGANRNALRQIVQDQCLAHWLQRHDRHPASGFTVFAPNRIGKAKPCLPIAREGRIFC